MGTESILPRMGSQAPREVAHLVPERRGSSCDWGGGAGPAPQLGIREAWRPHRGSGLRPRSPATCIPNPQAVLMGGRCFHSGCFWRAAVASLAAPRAEARAHTGPPRAPLALGRCAGGGGGRCLAGISSSSVSAVTKLPTFQLVCTELAGAAGEVPAPAPGEGSRVKIVFPTTDLF